MFQAWLVKMAKIAANSAPSTRPGASDMKKTIVIERKPRIGTDCRMSSSGMRTWGTVQTTAATVRMPANRYIQPVNQENVRLDRYFVH